MDDFATTASAPAIADPSAPDPRFDTPGFWPPAPPADRGLLMQLLDAVNAESQGLSDFVADARSRCDAEADPTLWAIERLVGRVFQIAHLGADTTRAVDPFMVQDLVGGPLTEKLQRRFWTDVGHGGELGLQEKLAGVERYRNLMEAVRAIDNTDRTGYANDLPLLLERIAKRLDVQLQELEAAPTMERRGFLLVAAKLFMLNSESDETGSAICPEVDEGYFGKMFAPLNADRREPQPTRKSSPSAELVIEGARLEIARRATVGVIDEINEMREVMLSRPNEALVYWAANSALLESWASLAFSAVDDRVETVESLTKRLNRMPATVSESEREACHYAENDRLPRWFELKRMAMSAAVEQSCSQSSTAIAAGALYLRQVMRSVASLETNNRDSSWHILQEALAAAAFDVPSDVDAIDFMYGFSMALGYALRCVPDFDPVEALVRAGICEPEPASIQQPSRTMEARRLVAAA